MINPQELRLGNWVHHKAEWSYRSEYDGNDLKEFDFQIELNDFYSDAECTFDFSDIDPIPLTEEWLLKFGFGVDTEFDNHFIDNVSMKNEVIRYATDSNYFTVELSLGQVLEIPNIKYAHQLQNLFYSLTGKELTIQQ